jgi:hypothetical protein
MPDKNEHPICGFINPMFCVMNVDCYYSGEIASTGQTSAHEPQSVHSSGSIT